MRQLLACVVIALAAGVAGAAASPRQLVPIHFDAPASLPDATQGTAYAYAFAGDVSGGTGPPYNWVLKGGSLPAGLHVNGGTGALSGTVAQGARAGAYAFTVCATGRKRPLTGSNVKNTACDSTRLTVDAKQAEPPPAPAAVCKIAAVPPGVTLQVDGSRQTVVISETPNCFKGQVTFSTVGSPPTGVSITFLAAPAGTQGVTLSLAASQDASEGVSNITILASSPTQKAQTVVQVTVSEPNFAGTYTGTWTGTFTSTNGDGCVFQERGTATVVLVKSLPGSYNVTITFNGTVDTWNSNPCQIQTTGPAVFRLNATYSNGTVTGSTITITGNSGSGTRTDAYAGGSETISFRVQR